MNKLQYITTDHPSRSHSDLALDACMAGAKWIQLRMKSATDEEMLQEAISIRAITKVYRATFIINDRIQLVDKCDADGVHLGLGDLPTDEARALLGPNKIIGGTANSINDVVSHYENKVDYVGVGPYQFTETKKNLSDPLGVIGYQNLMDKLQEMEINLPVFAIGGIKENDIDQIMQTGVYGIAVSGLITDSLDKTELINRINNIQYAYNSEQTI